MLVICGLTMSIIQKNQPTLVFNEVEEMEANNRGGFGSTGTK